MALPHVIGCWNSCLSIELPPRQPREIPNFRTIINPIDQYVLIFLMVTAMSMTSILMLIDKFYSWRNETSYDDTVYKNNIIMIYYILENDSILYIVVLRLGDLFWVHGWRGCTRQIHWHCEQEWETLFKGQNLSCPGVDVAWISHNNVLQVRAVIQICLKISYQGFLDLFKNVFDLWLCTKRSCVPLRSARRMQVFVQALIWGF